MAEVSLRDLGKSYAGHQVFSAFDLQIADGECFTLLGPSGCGKTVILRLVAGFEQPSAGEIIIGGSLVSSAQSGFRLPPEERRIGVVFQDYAVWPHKSVFENVIYPLEIQKLPKPEAQKRCNEAIAQVGLAGLEQRMPSQLSGGQQQRVALARALVCRPKVMLLDEPLCNLDANLREEMRFEIRRLQRETGLTILYVTHDQEIALAISDRLGIMDGQGRLRQVGKPEEVFDQAADSFVFGFMGLANFLKAEFRDGQAVLASSGAQLAVDLPDFAASQDFGYLACRPGDIDLIPGAEGAQAEIKRQSVLGAHIDYRLDLAGQELRVQLDTRQAQERGLILEPGSRCGVSFQHLRWFDSLSQEGGGA